MSFTIWIKYNNEQAIILRKHEATVDLESDEIVDQSFANTAKAPIQVFTTEKIEPGERYQIVAFHITTIRKDVDWSQIEDKAVEDETLLAVKNFLNKMFKLTVEIFPHRIMYKNQESIMEWDGILTCDNKVFLLETKHKMTAKHIENLINRLSEFQNKLVITDSLEFKKLLGNIMLELLAVRYLLTN
ncbi:unnamed protein product [Rhizophagus irregularis]|nr:unnamed protein product [Rhizophagus irregularis]